MTMTALDFRHPATPPVFLNFRSKIIYWDGPGDTLYAFEDRDAFERQRTAAERHFVHIQERSAEEAADWIAGGAMPSCTRHQSPALRHSEI